MSEGEFSERPWGNYTVLSEDAPDHKVKRIVVHPGKRLSLAAPRQAGRALVHRGGYRQVTLDGAVSELTPGGAIDIPLGAAHRIANEGDGGRRVHRGAARDLLRRGRHRADRRRLRAGRGRGGAAGAGAGSGTGDHCVTKIADLLAAGKTYSFEFFPPKNDAELATLARTIGELQPLEPVLRVGHLPGWGRVSPADVRPGQRHAAHDLAQPHGPPHLRGPHPARAGRHTGHAAQGRCGEPDGAGRRPPDRTPIGRPRGAGLRQPSWWSWPGPSAGSRSAWPPTRPATPARPSTESDRDFLAAKLEMADFGVTQFFFEAAEYEGLVADLDARGVATPVLPGILPVTSLSTMGRLGAMGAAAPEWMQERLRGRPRAGGPRPCGARGSSWPPSCVPTCSSSAFPACTFTPSTLPARPGRSMPLSVSDLRSPPGSWAASTTGLRAAPPWRAARRRRVMCES